MKEFSKKERNEIYKKAKELYEKQIIYNKNRPYCGLCTELKHSISFYLFYTKGISSYYTPGSQLLILLPEFAKFKPKDVTWYSYWWDIQDISSRVEALDVMIAMTE